MDHLAEILKLKSQLAIERKARKKATITVKKMTVGLAVHRKELLGFSQDITQRIRTEQELLVSKKITEDGAHAKETFLANMSHEIRTPINGILGMAGLLAKTELNLRQQNFLKLIQESANNLLVIVNDVLDLEKIIAGKLQLEQLPFKMVDKIAIIVQSFIYRAEEKGVAIIYQNAIPGELIVTGDPFRLSQILNNILSNAIKFTETGNITITTRITSFKDEIANIEFTIKDTGIGICEEKIKEIFKPFVQADAAISRKYGGTGLGLTICKNLLEMQGGELRVESELNVGSAFSFTIPYRISDGPFGEVDAAVEINYSSLGRRKVLVAEDVEMNQFIARHIMESWGFDVSVANDGKEAVQMVAENNYDLVLMDIQMPEMDGIAAMGQIRRMKDPMKANLPIIALTAHALKGDSEKYMDAGMNDYLSKPFMESTLFQVIARNLTDIKLKLINMKEAQPIVTESFLNGKLYDLSTIRTVSGDDEEFVKKMIYLFIETVPANLKELNVSVESENWDMVSKMAHKLKSTLDSMGIHSVKQDIRTVEHNAKRKESVSVIPPLVQKINVVIKKCIVQLEKEILHPVF